MISAINRPRALTFIETLIVVIIIGILTALAVPRFSRTFAGIKQNIFIKDIYYLCHYLRNTAVAQRRIYGMNIDIDKRELWVGYRQERQLQRLSGRLAKTYKVPTGSSIYVEPMDKSIIYFYPDATIDKAGITLEDKNGLRVSLRIKGGAGGIEIK